MNLLNPPTVISFVIQPSNLILVLMMAGKAQDQLTETLQTAEEVQHSAAPRSDTAGNPHKPSSCGVAFTLFCLNRAWTFDPSRTIPEIIHCLLKEKVANCIAKALCRVFHTSNQTLLTWLQPGVCPREQPYAKGKNCSGQLPLHRYL